MSSETEIGEAPIISRMGLTSAEALAASLASAASKDPALAARAASLLQRQAEALEEQIHVLRAQKEHLALQIADVKREDRVRHWSLRVRHINDVMKVVFSFGVAFMALVVAIGFGAMIWNAHEAKGLIVQPLRVPQDFAQRGLDGTV